MPKRGKKYREAFASFDAQQQYDAKEAMEILVKMGTAKFDETVEAHIKLGVDGRHADQQVRGAIVTEPVKPKECWYLPRVLRRKKQRLPVQTL